MSSLASQITSLAIVYSTVCSGPDQRKHQSSALLAFVREIHRWPVNSPHKGPVTRKMFQFDDVIMYARESMPGKGHSSYNSTIPFIRCHSFQRNPMNVQNSNKKKKPWYLKKQWHLDKYQNLKTIWNVYTKERPINLIWLENVVLFSSTHAGS